MTDTVSASQSPPRPPPKVQAQVVNLLTDPPRVNLVDLCEASEAEDAAEEEAQVFAALIPKHDVELRCPLFSPAPVPLPFHPDLGLSNPKRVREDAEEKEEEEDKEEYLARVRAVCEGASGPQEYDVEADPMRVFIYQTGDNEVTACFTSVERARAFAQRHGDGGIILEMSVDRPWDLFQLSDHVSLEDQIVEHAVMPRKAKKVARTDK